MVFVHKILRMDVPDIWEVQNNTFWQWYEKNKNIIYNIKEYNVWNVTVIFTLLILMRNIDYICYWNLKLIFHKYERCLLAYIKLKCFWTNPFYGALTFRTNFEQTWIQHHSAILCQSFQEVLAESTILEEVSGIFQIGTRNMFIIT